jgi:hypothetical protein
VAKGGTYETCCRPDVKPADKHALKNPILIAIQILMQSGDKNSKLIRPEKTEMCFV